MRNHTFPRASQNIVQNALKVHESTKIRLIREKNTHENKYPRKFIPLKPRKIDHRLSVNARV